MECPLALRCSLKTQSVNLELPFSCSAYVDHSANLFLTFCATFHYHYELVGFLHEGHIDFIELKLSVKSVESERDVVVLLVE